MKKVGQQLLAASLVLVGGIAWGQQAVQARTSYTSPKSFRHTWYHYVGHGKYDKMTFSKHAYSSDEYAGGEHYHEHRKFKLFGPSKSGYWSLYGIDQTAGAGNNFKVMTRTFGGKRHAVLNNYYGYYTSDITHYYRFKTHHQ